ncbi:unnamed protein product [Mytilus coruscus]|uniref:Uncharacterized protein n=1 Tax=Mytilus coruscus TaxID=42192 RepID=A0A6J8DT88_MYTCO|nr:unnamed protein product [Mytilus coruscus]
MDEDGSQEKIIVAENKQRGIDIFDICLFISTTELCIGYLRGVGLLVVKRICSICNIEMSKIKRKDISDGEFFRCTECMTKISIRKDSIFENSRLQLKHLMMIVYFFGIDLQIYECGKLIHSLSHTTVIEWFSILRGICSKVLIDMPWKLRRDISGNVIEIDESLFGKKRKYHRGTGNQNVWVFGATERSTRNAFMQIVEKRDMATLLPIIKMHIETGSTIFF